jgi:hypothetical protein
MHVNHRIPAVLGTALIIFAGAALAQDPAKTLNCDQRGGDSRQERVCEMREMTLPGTGALNVDASPNGGVSVKAWSQAGVLVRAKVEAWGETKTQAESRLNEVLVETAGNKVTATGPKTMGRTYYSVSYEVFVPKSTNLDLHSTNGGISINGVNGTIEARTTNGGLKLAGLSGKVTAHTTNGGVKVELAGNTWQGEGFDVSTTNGGVDIQVPADYSARLEARTTNGGFRSDLPVKAEGGFTGKRVNATLGRGGALVKVQTTNGGIRLNRAGV